MARIGDIKLRRYFVQNNFKYLECVSLLIVPVVSHLPVEILDYVHTHQPPIERAFGIGQQELAHALGYHSCSMSRPLSDLVGKGFLAERRAPVRGGLRRHLVYSLTELGRARLEKQSTDVPFLSNAIPSAPTPFVGRKTELRRMLDFVRIGGGLVTVEGQAGMGKTSLAARFLRRAKSPETVPFWITVRDATSARHVVLALAHALSPLGAQQLAYYGGLPREPKGAEVADLVRRTVDKRVLLAVIDDLHTAGPDLRSFLMEFSESLVDERPDVVLLLGHSVPREFDPTTRICALELAGIDRASAHELTDRKGGLAERFEPVFNATRGNPLLLQLALSVTGELPSPTSLPAVVVSKLGIEEAIALLPLALANEPLPEAFFREEGGISAARMEQLSHQGILGHPAPGHLEIPQVLRVAFAARVDSAQVRAAHLELARFYGRSHRPDAVRERFLHSVMAGAYVPAGELLLRQEAALLVSGDSKALRSALERVADLASQPPLRVRALRTLAGLQRLRKEYREGLASLARAAELAGDDARLKGECLLSSVDHACNLHDLASAEKVLEQAAAIGLPTRRLQVYAQLAETRLSEEKGDLNRARIGYPEVFTQARRHRQDDLALEALARWSGLASLGGNREEAMRLVEAGIPEARNSGRVDILFRLLMLRARNFHELGDLGSAEEELLRIRTEFEALGYLSQVVYALSGLVGLYADRERWAEMDEVAERTIDIAGRVGNDLVLGHTLALQCNGKVRQGDPGAATALGERGIAILERLPISDSLALAHAFLGGALADSGRLPESKKHYEEAIHLAERLEMPWWKESITQEMRTKFGPPGGPTASAAETAG